jgi:predicted metal-dependent phosphoesterase TrpH
MKRIIDLHTHSYISDGASTPKEVIKSAYKNNVSVIALTDHDSFAGIKEASDAAKEYGITLINGIELSALYEDGRILHILGIGIDIENQDFLKSYYKMKKAREAGIPNILKHISIHQGLDIDLNILKGHALDEYLARYDIHRYIIQNKICTDGQVVWNRYLDPIPYAKDELLAVEEVLDIIKKAGGVSFLAHYNKEIGLGGFNKIEMEKHIKYLISCGLNGVERYYPSFKEEDYEFLDYLIEKYYLLASGGTDFHGANRTGIDVGIGAGNMAIPYDLYENIITKIEKK